jgi:hypothetical protein
MALSIKSLPKHDFIISDHTYFGAGRNGITHRLKGFPINTKQDIFKHLTDIIA